MEKNLMKLTHSLIKPLFPLVSVILIIIATIGFLENFVNILQVVSPKLSSFAKTPFGILLEIVIFFGSLYAFLFERFSVVKEVSESYYKEIHRTIGSIKGVLPNGNETDVVRKLLKMQLGDIAEKILPLGVSFPVTLVPGGDVALIMNQSMYSKILKDLVIHAKDNSDYKVFWTTFVPFESLNRSLSGYDESHWQNRIKGTLNFIPPSNDTFFNYISTWRSLENRGKQVIILDTSEGGSKAHPMNYANYMAGGEYNLDIIKYLSVRYENILYTDVDNGKASPLVLNAFIRLKENVFISDMILRESVNSADSNTQTVKWISLAQVRNIIQNQNSRKIIHNIDFVYFDKPDNDFVLVRIDADNKFVIDGGIVGVTYVIFTSDNLKLYGKLFNEMFNQASQTFYDLTGKKL